MWAEGDKFGHTFTAYYWYSFLIDEINAQAMTISPHKNWMFSLIGVRFKNFSVNAEQREQVAVSAAVQNVDLAHESWPWRKETVKMKEDKKNRGRTKAENERIWKKVKLARTRVLKVELYSVHRPLGTLLLETVDELPN